MLLDHENALAHTSMLVYNFVKKHTKSCHSHRIHQETNEIFVTVEDIKATSLDDVKAKSAYQMRYEYWISVGTSI